MKRPKSTPLPPLNPESTGFESLEETASQFLRNLIDRPLNGTIESCLQSDTEPKKPTASAFCSILALGLMVRIRALYNIVHENYPEMAVPLFKDLMANLQDMNKGTVDPFESFEPAAPAGDSK